MYIDEPTIYRSIMGTSWTPFSRKAPIIFSSSRVYMPNVYVYVYVSKERWGLDEGDRVMTIARLRYIQKLKWQ